MPVHLSDQFILLFKHVHTSLQSIFVPMLERLTSNKYTVKDSFNFAIEITEQDFSNFMGSLDIDSLFTNISLKETIEICTKNLFKNSGIVHGLKKNEFKDLLSLATKELCFIFSNILYKQNDGLAMRSPLVHSLANPFLAHLEQDWLDNYPLEYRPSYYRRYIDDLFVFFKSSDHLKRFQSYLNSCHANINMSFTV